nr:alpha-xylosidase [Quercus suber]
MDGYQFPCDPTANAEAVVSGPKYRFTFIDDRVLRYEWAEDGCFEDRASTFALWRNFPKPVFRVKDKQDQLELVTSSFHLTYDKQEFSSHGFAVSFSPKMTSWGAEWRYGQIPQENLGGTARTLDDVDGRCDMGQGILSRAGYSILDDTDSMLFDGHGFVTPRRPGTRIDGYIFAYGADFRGAMESFYAISGRQPPVPRWCLGNWWSRYHAYDHAEYLALMDGFRQIEIPLSVAVIDMDWHWVKEPFVPHSGWTGYSWNTNLFPSPEAFTRSLHDRGLKVTLNDHPHLGVHEHEDVYDQLAKRLGHDTTHRTPILFDPTSPHFMQAFFDLVHRRLEDTGCDFWWIDWQQGLKSRIPGFDPLWLLNHFQFLDTKQADPKSRPLILSRYAGPGSHRYPVGFSGDTFATWASLQFQPEFTATASNIGFGWWSHDIGGHLPGDRDDECTTRWIQYAVFSPILRLHSTHNRWMSKEPWLYRHEHMLAMRNALQYRHRLVPYIYSANASSRTILPLVQPLYWSFPTREVAYQFPNQYYFGPSLIVSPIVDPRDTRTNLAKSKVWIPPSRHVDIFNGIVYDGDRELDMYRSLNSIPVLAPEGSIIPLDGDAAPANGCKNPDAFEIIVVVGQNGSSDIKPLVQPLYWSFPTREVAYQFPNQYYFGPSLIVSPIVDPRDTRTNLAKSKVWIPPSRHVDIFNGIVYDGDRELDMYRSLNSIPVLAPEGSIIPLDGDAAPANGCKNPDAFEIIVVVGQNGSSDINEEIQDDRKGSGDEPTGRRSLNISFDQTAGRLSFDSGKGKAWVFRFISARIELSSIKVHIAKTKIPGAECTIESRDHYADTVVNLKPAELPANSRITIDLGQEPRLDIHNHTQSISQLLLDYQTAFRSKDRIWEIIQTSQPTTVKVGRLLSLGLHEAFVGPIVELLLADSRT